MATTEANHIKALLLKSSTSSGLNLYDHLAELIQTVLNDNSGNAVDKIESISAQLKANKFHDKSSTIKDQPEISARVVLANTQAHLFKPDRIPEEDESITQLTPNLMEVARFFEDNDIGVGREESFRIFLALRHLADTQPLKSVRFWGKIFGIQSNYIIAEAEYREGEEPQPEESSTDDRPQSTIEEPEATEEQQDPLPKSNFKAPKPLPAENYGSGVNKKVYFVASEPGTQWQVLPHVTPAQIVAARHIKKFFTGKLDAAVRSYPPFPGNEANLLRAQIARITASTLVSPVGYYTFEEGDDEEERTSFIVNEEFEEKSRSELLDPTLAGWVHHGQFILPQGRCTWVNPNPKSEQKENDDDEEENEEAETEVEPETGPSLLSSLQNDQGPNGSSAWTTKLSSTFIPGYSSVTISSNIWIGAHAFALGKKFENIYVGWGVKYSPEAYSPPLPPAPQVEYPSGTDVTEANDPSREEETAFEASQVQQTQEQEEGEEEEEDS